MTSLGSLARAAAKAGEAPRVPAPFSEASIWAFAWSQLGAMIWSICLSLMPYQVVTLSPVNIAFICAAWAGLPWVSLATFSGSSVISIRVKVNPP